MTGNEEERMEDLKVKTILILELQMKDKSLDDNYKVRNWWFILRWTIKYIMKNLWSRNPKLIYWWY
jgi:hypothetical protein